MAKRKFPKEPIELTISDLSHDGKGVARHNDKVVFVNDALPGEVVLCKIHKRQRKYDEAHILEVIERSQDRIEPRCEFFTNCGACSLQHLSSEKQIAFKQNGLVENIRKMAHVDNFEILAPLKCEPWGYRRKARLGARFVPKKGKVLVGFREKRSPYLADMNSCQVLDPSIGLKLEPLGELIKGFEHRQDIPQVEVSIGDGIRGLVFRHLVELPEKDIQALRDFGSEHGFQIYLQPKGPDTIHCVWPEDPKPLSYELNDYTLKLEFLPSDFTQINAEINQKMIPLALELLNVEASDTVMDLFCGLGNFSLPLAKTARHVIAVEGESGLVERARKNATLNNIENIEFHVANLYEAFDQFSWAKQTVDKMLLDPPRSGALELAQRMKKFGPKRIVYVSCNPATLARDVDELVNRQGYRLLKAGVMDMFPQTAHVESIAVFEKAK